jgi:hypothetical protein
MSEWQQGYGSKGLGIVKEILVYVLVRSDGFIDFIDVNFFSTHHFQVCLRVE